jgi:hypothetical protein
MSLLLLVRAGIRFGFSFWVAEGSRLLEGWDEVDEKKEQHGELFNCADKRRT